MPPRKRKITNDETENVGATVDDTQPTPRKYLPGKRPRHLDDVESVDYLKPLDPESELFQNNAEWTIPKFNTFVNYALDTLSETYKDIFKDFIKLPSRKFHPQYYYKIENPISINEIPFNSWLSKQKVSKEEKLDLILKESLESAGMEGDTLDLEFPDLIKKFQFTKMLQAKTGYLIPDFQLTVLAKPSDFKTYFIDEILSGKLARFNEAEPNAIHLTKESYDAPNIYLENTIEERDISGKQQRKKFNTILKQMHDLDEVKTETLIENARRADGASQ